MSDSLRVGVAQVRSYLGDVERNLETHLDYVERAKKEGVDVLAFPELSLTGYLLRDLAYEVSGRSYAALELVEFLFIPSRGFRLGSRRPARHRSAGCRVSGPGEVFGDFNPAPQA